MTEQPQKLKIFLCHASENKPIVYELYSLLKTDGFDPWLDSEYLLPGMDWDLEIQQAMRASDVVIVCLSNISVKKEGYVQKEIKYAREIQKEKPDGTIFLIPVQVENCNVPFSLQNVQWGKYFEVDGYEKIIKALQVRADQLGRVVMRPNSELSYTLPPGSYLPFARNALFTGREEDLKQLEKSLLSNNSASTLISQTVSGMGGIGKTQLAVEFAYRYSHKFKSIHWLDLHDPAALDSQIAQCGMQMRLQPWSDQLPEQVLLTLAAWKADGPRLLILDNFEDPREGHQVLSGLQAPSVRLLITSRRSDWPATLGIRPLALEVFTEQESIDFLHNHTKDKFSKELLNTLAAKLGHLPLALELAGLYLEKHPRLTVEGYLSKLEKALDHESMRGFRKDLPSPTRHDIDLLSTFSLSWDEIKDETARKLFQVAGYCAPNTPIPLEILEKTLDLDETACDGGLDILVGLGLLKENAIIHPLLADYARHLDPENLILSALAERLAEISSERNAEVDRTGKYSLYSPLLPHVRSVAEGAEAAQIQSTGSLWNSLGYHIYDLADYAAARAAFEHALKINEAAFGPDHPNVARDVNNLGSVLQDQGDLAAAKAGFERALQIFEQALGSEHPNVATLINNVGSVLQDQGDLAGARAAYERALKIDEAAFGPDHPEVATDVNNLGDVLRDLGDLAGAKAAYERALKIDEAASGPHHPMVAIRVNNVGGVLKALGDLAGARAAYERALEIDEAAFGPDHPNVAIDINNLGLVLQALGDLAGARAAYERALKIFKQFLPEGHQYIRTAEGNLRGLAESES